MPRHALQRVCINTEREYRRFTLLRMVLQTHQYIEENFFFEPEHYEPSKEGQGFLKFLVLFHPLE